MVGRSIGEIALFSGRLDEVVTFYEQVSGSPAVERSDDHALFRCGPVVLLIHSTSTLSERGTTAALAEWPPDEDHFSLEIERLDVLVAALTQDGVQVAGPREYPWGRSAYVRDPDGRLVELASRDQ